MSNPQPTPETPNAPTQRLEVTQQEGAVRAQLSDEMRTLAGALAREDEVGAEILKGVVQSVNLNVAPPVFSMTLQGDESVIIDGARFMDSYTPTVGDTVLVLKQQSNVFALGTIATGATTPAVQGWLPVPSLASGVTTESFDPAMYRVIVDHGSRKVQLRGSVNLNATQTTLWTMPAGIRPLLNKRPIIVARGYGGGAVAVQLNVNANGTMVLSGSTTGVAGVASSGAGTTSSTGEHAHWEYNGNNTKPGNAGANFTDWNGIHTHSTPNHGHTMDFVDHPDWVSFNGVEYFL